VNQCVPCLVLAVLAALVTGCQRTDRVATPAQPSLKPRLTFLTRDECVNTPVMLASLDQALNDSGYAVEYVVTDTATLPATDPRCGYGTPTILLDGRDMFGRAEPARGVHHVPM
jgi:hypothetical protein